MGKEEEKKEELGLKDTVSAEVKKGQARAGKDVTAAAERDKAISEAHDKYVKDTEAARIAYVTAKEEANRKFEEATK